MAHAEKYATSPYSSHIIFNRSDIPSDLRDLVELGAKVERKRHPDYPHGIWFDNVRVHAIRCALTAKHLTLPPGIDFIRQPLERTLWIHDLPEVVTSLDNGFDTSAVTKEDQPALAASIEKAETAAARKMLSPADYALFDQFERARGVLDGSAKPNLIIGPAAYGARIIDIGDAEMCFYHFLTAWLIHDSYDGRLPTERPYRFTMKRYKVFLTNVNILRGAIPDQLYLIYKDLLTKQVRYILARWKLVEDQRPELLPDIARQQMIYLISLMN